MILFLLGLLAGAAIAAWMCKWDLLQAAHERSTAEAALLQADDMLAAAERSAVRAEALTTPTGEMQVVRPLSVRVRMAGRSAREWARETFAGPSQGPVWAPGELKSLAPKPPLRTRGELAPARGSWPLAERRLSPFPLLDAAPFSLSYGGSK